MTTATETKQRHTEGPWSIRRSNDGSGDVGITAPGLRNVLAECFGAMRCSGERAVDEAMANARLMSAAPDMFDALGKITGQELFNIAVNDVEVSPERMRVLLGEIYETARVAFNKAAPEA